MASIHSYNFSVEMIFLLGTKSYKIASTSVKSILLNYDYDKNNMPIIYVGVRLTTEVYNKMVLNSDKGTVSFRLFKSMDNGVNSSKSLYIEDNFLYVMSSDPNYYEIFEQYLSGGSTNNADGYMEGYIGLVSIKNINDNKKLFNNILKNTDLISIIHKYTNHMRMCIEPFDNNAKISQFIIPPITSITNLIAYIDNYYYLYKTGYRFFRDFDTTYLLSTKGIAVKEKNNRFDTVILSIEDPLNEIGRLDSMVIDTDNHAYIIYTDASDTSIHVDRVTDKQHNSIIGVDTQGKTYKESLSVPKYLNSTKKAILERTSNNNLTKISNTKSLVESTSIVVTVTKTEIDSTILTPNKEYYIKNFNNNKKYNGRYILSYKKEIMYRKNNVFKNSVMFGLRKAIEG